MIIVDSQVHIWAANTPQRPWPTVNVPRPHREVPFSKDDLLREMDLAGVHRAILVPPSWEGDRNDVVLEAARLHPSRFAAMGRFDLGAQNARDQLAAWRSQPGMLGLRLAFVQPALHETLRDGRLDWLWNEAELRGIPIMLAVTAEQLDLVEKISSRHPHLKFAIDHLALSPGKKDDEAFARLHLLLALSKLENISVKVSGLPYFTRDEYPYRSLHANIRRVYDAFGPSRMFWGSDLSKLPCTYKQAITMFTEEIPWLGSKDKELIMGHALSEWLGWKLA